MIDLHTHTTASDGSMTPDEMVKKAKSLGITHLGITDHDTVNGIDDALKAGKIYGVTVIPGVELGTDYMEVETHILGYFREDNYIKINHYFEWILEKRHHRNIEMINKLRSKGFDISIDEVKKKADGGIQGRPHIAQILVEKGYAVDINEVFNRILLRKDIYIKREKTSPLSAISEINKAGGIPVLAHPVYLDQANEFEKALDLFVSYGLRGIEVYHSDHFKEHEEKYRKAAEKHHLLMTGGSDFHGDNKDRITLGSVRMPDELAENLLKALGRTDEKSI